MENIYKVQKLVESASNVIKNPQWPGWPYVWHDSLDKSQGIAAILSFAGDISQVKNWVMSATAAHQTSIITLFPRSFILFIIRRFMGIRTPVPLREG
jgi:hypothetical protein